MMSDNNFSMFAEIDGNINSIMEEIPTPEEVILLPTKKFVLFPGILLPILVNRRKMISLVKKAEKDNLTIGVVCQTNPEAEEPTSDDLASIGVYARVLKCIDMPGGMTTAIIQAHKKFKVDDLHFAPEGIWAHVTTINETTDYKDDLEFSQAVDYLKKLSKEFLKANDDTPNESNVSLGNLTNALLFINFTACNMPFTLQDKLKLIETNDAKERLFHTIYLLDKQLQLVKINNRIREKTHGDLDQQQRKYFLQQQIKNLQEEMGMHQEVSPEKIKLQEKAKAKRWSREIQQLFKSEMEKLDQINPQSADYNVQLSYLQTLVSLPWNEYTFDDTNIQRAERVLNRDHYAMEKAKERILEYIAVLSLKKDPQAPIICLYGPPGVGKTSLGKSVAESLRRKYVRVSLGGVHDESEIRGHRRTYVGAMPGRIIKGMQKAGSSNPVFILDEIDKVTQNNYNGDPASALLEVLDPEQNKAFHDNYLDCDYDLSRVLFIATANDLTSIPKPLLDRMEIIELSGYITEEKIEIAKRHFVPKEKTSVGLEDTKISFNKAALETIIEKYTRESGVRQLEKQINKALRKLAFSLAKEGTLPVEKIKPADIEQLLGKPPYNRDIYQGNKYAGVVTGLAWTSVGGEILFIETSLSKGKDHKLTLTGNLGDVMKESAVLALEYVKSHYKTLNIDYRIFDNWNIHIHVPEGATPKDGPSAGITIATSIASALTQRKVRQNTAMTGEITLRGKVLPVGGIKEKILAAKRAGITNILLCKDNAKDIEEIPEIYLNGVNFHYVENINEVWDFALLDKKVDNALVFDVEDNNDNNKKD